MRLRSITLLLTRQLPKANPLGATDCAQRLAVLAKNVLLFHDVSLRARIHHVLAVGKMGYAAHDDTLHDIAIVAPAGLRVLAPFTGAADIPTRNAWAIAE
jgi:hypothetical protein